MKYLFSSIVILLICLRHCSVMACIWIFFFFRILWHFKVTKRSIIDYRKDAKDMKKNTTDLLEYFI